MYDIRHTPSFNYINTLELLKYKIYLIKRFFTYLKYQEKIQRGQAFKQKLLKINKKIKKRQLKPRRKQYQDYLILRARNFEQTASELSIRKLVILSIKNFINKYQNLIKISVKDQELKIDMSSIHIKIFQCQPVYFVRQLMIALKEKMGRIVTNLKDVEDIEIQQKLTYTFQNLFKLLRHTLNAKIKSIENTQIDSLDIFCLPLAICEQSELSKIPIFIGGLRSTCMKFFRKIIQMILSHSQLLINDIGINYGNLTLKEKSQLLRRIRSFISKKSETLRSYQVEEQIQTIKQEMKENISLKGINHFNDSVFHIMWDQFGQQYSITPKNLDRITIQSYKLHKLKKIFNRFHDESIIEIKNDLEIKLENYRIKGKFYSQIFMSIDDINERLLLADFLRQCFQQKANLAHEDQEFGIQRVFFHGSNPQDQVEFILFNSGEYHLIGIQKLKCSQYQAKIEHHFLSYMAVIKIAYNYIYRSRLGVKCKPTILEQIPGFKDKLTGLLRTKVKKSIQNKKRQIIQTRLITENRWDYTQQENQTLKDRPFKRYVRYRHKIDQNMNKQIIVDIKENGHVKVVGDLDQESTFQLLKFIKGKIQEQVEVKCFQIKNQQNQKLECYKLMIGGNNKRESKLQQFANQQRNENYQVQSLRLQIGLQVIDSEKTICGVSRGHNLKLVIWNIQLNKYDQQSEYPQQKLSQLKKWKKWRLNVILNKIKQQNVDFICLQEASQLFKQYNRKTLQCFLKFIQDETDYNYCVPEKHQYIKGQDNKHFHRTIILSKIPVDFYDIKFPQDYQTSIMSLCTFSMHVQNQVLKVLLVSIHLKAFQNRKVRQKQLKVLKQLSNEFDLTILAGDFNIGEDLRKYPENSELNNYIDIVQKFGPNGERPITYVSDKYGLQRLDRILLNFKKKKRFDKIVNSLNARIRIIGNSSCLPYEDTYYKDAQNLPNPKSTSLSDHYGLSAEIMFLKESSLQ